MILVTGASGSVGREVVREVQKTGQAFCAMYRSKEEAGKAPVGTKTAIADFGDTTSLLSALQGVDRVYLVCSPIQELVQLEGNAIDACKRAGVKKIVLNSALGAGDSPGSAFPSSHVAGAVTIAYACSRWLPPRIATLLWLEAIGVLRPQGS